MNAQNILFKVLTCVMQQQLRQGVELNLTWYEKFIIFLCDFVVLRYVALITVEGLEGQRILMISIIRNSY